MIGLAQFTASMNVCNILTPVKINISFIISQISINIGGKPYHEIKFNEVDAHKKTTSGSYDGLRRSPLGSKCILSSEHCQKSSYLNVNKEDHRTHS